MTQLGLRVAYCLKGLNKILGKQYSPCSINMKNYHESDQVGIMFQELRREMVTEVPIIPRQFLEEQRQTLLEPKTWKERELSYNY